MNKQKLPEIIFISSYPPRECGIATYSQDLIRALNNKFDHSFNIHICALESESEMHTYPNEVNNILDTSDPFSFEKISRYINGSSLIKIVMLQHEFGFFHRNEQALLNMIQRIKVPVVITFHTVLPNPDEKLKHYISQLASASFAISVMTQNAADILKTEYDLPVDKITVIAHGTHLVQHTDKEFLKIKHGVNGKTILSTFGLISSGKNIETTLHALPEIIKRDPNVLFLIIGKTHPAVVKHDGEAYRDMLEDTVKKLQLVKHVKFINHYVPLSELLEYLQLTDIYLFTSKDPNQAVSGTFAYAISCGCPIISTPIPHAKEVFAKDSGILIDFESPDQLSEAVNRLLMDEKLRSNISSSGLHRMASTAWENASIAHAILFEQLGRGEIVLEYNRPKINLHHLKKLTTKFGMIQFSQNNHPDIKSGYTLDDNARAMIAMCMHYELSGDSDDLNFITLYLQFIEYCIQSNGRFMNYVNSDRLFTPQNKETNLDDANGRAIWALGYLIHLKFLLPKDLITKATKLITVSLAHIEHSHSTRAMAFALKGLYYFNDMFPSLKNVILAQKLAMRLERMYMHECESGWEWFESYLTYGNSVLPEGMLCAYLITKNNTYRTIAKTSFDFLLDKTFTDYQIKMISNRKWLMKGESSGGFGEQPIDAAYTILALDRFYHEFEDDSYIDKISLAINWFLGNNHLRQIIYNPCTGGCYDGLEETNVNLNQGAESTVSYLMARLIVEKYELKTPEFNIELVQQEASA